MEYSFETAPPLGFVHLYHGQRYELIGVAPYTNKHGELATMLTWRSSCAECGEPFIASGPLKSNGLNRRCAMHRKAGVPASAEAREKRAGWLKKGRETMKKRRKTLAPKSLVERIAARERAKAKKREWMRRHRALVALGLK